MKKILSLIFLLTTYTMVMQAKTVSETVYSEDFSDVCNIDYTEIPEEGSDYYVIWERVNLNGGVSNADMVLDCYASGPVSSYMNFNYTTSDITDNWTLTFRGLVYPDDYSGVRQQFALYGSNCQIESHGLLESNTFLALTNDADNPSVYTIKLGNTTLSETCELLSQENYYYTLKCEKANTSTATLTLTITDGTSTLVSASTTVDAAAIGNPMGFFNYNEDSYGDVYFDDIVLAKDKTIEDVTCSDPTYAITAAYEKERTFTLSCASSNATIYYSETDLTLNSKDWIEYTGPVSTTSTNIYAYACIKEYEENSNIISFETGAGTKLKLAKPTLTIVDYDTTNGYKYIIDTNIDEVEVVPTEYNVQYSIDGATFTNLTDFDNLYIPEGSYLKVRTVAAGYSNSTTASHTTVAFPKVPEIWSQNFDGLVNSGYSTSKLSLNLSSKAAFDYSLKTFYNINSYNNGSAVNVNIDKRIGLTTSSNFYLYNESADSCGLYSDFDASTITGSGTEGVEDTSIKETEGLGITGITSGQYIIISTNGAAPEAKSGCSYIKGASTIYTHVFEAYADTAYIILPYKYCIKNIKVCSNEEVIQMNSTGYMTYISENSLYFEEVDGLTAYAVTGETRSGVFTQQEVVEIPTNTAVILHGTPNTTYNVPLGSCTTLACNNMLTGSRTSDFDPTTWEGLPVYVVSTVDGSIVKADKTSTIPAGEAYIKSNLEEAEYKDIKIGESGETAIICEKALDFSDTEGIQAYVVTYESISGFNRMPITKAPAGAAIIVTGTKNTTYSVPVGVCTELAYTNILRGSLSSAYNTNDTINMIYVYSDENAKLEKIDKSTVTTIPAGQVYVISKYFGFENITANTAGAAYHVSQNALTFTEVALRAYIATGETEDGIILKEVTEVPANTAFIVKSGVADSTYTVPFGTCTALSATNKFTVSDNDFDTSTQNYYVYTLADNTADVTKTTDDAVIPAGQVYVISEYLKEAEEGTEYVEVNSTGKTSVICEHALDFTTMEGLTAYVADYENINEGIHFTTVTEVPAGTAFYVEGEPGIYSVPVGTCTELAVNNLIKGNKESGLYLGNVTTHVYTLSTETGEWVITNPESGNIEAGIPYIISKYRGFEEVSTNAIGVASYITEYPWDLTELKDQLTVYIVDNETPTSFNLVPITAVPANTPILLKSLNGTQTTFKVPINTELKPLTVNLLTGSRTESKAVSDYKTYVYALSGKTGNLTKVSSTATIPAGKAYLVSKYVGYDYITTNENGYVSCITKNPLNFLELYNDLAAYIATDETISEITLERATRVPANTPLMLQGKASTKYTVPIDTVEVEIDNLLKGSNDEVFDVSGTDYLVYAMSAETGQLAKVANDAVIPAGKAYFISKYKGFENITMNSNGVTSYVCENALDLNELKGSLTAYAVVSESETGFDLQPIYEVPAGTAFFLKGQADSTYAVPYGTCEELAVENLTRGSRTESYDTSNTTKEVYALSKKTSEITLVAYNTVIPAGKAYIISKYDKSTSTSAKKAFNFTDEDATGISNTSEDSTRKTGRLINLAGQVVDDDYKGIVIDENGRKYLKE